MAATSAGIEPPRATEVLLVDDDESVQDVVVEILRDAGYVVAAVRNGREALAWLGAHPPPQLILLDLWMPVMDGFTFRAEQVREPRLAGIPVVLLTAVPERSQDVVHSAQAVLRKPVHIDRLLEVVASFVGEAGAGART